MISALLVFVMLLVPAASILMIHHITISETIVSMNAGYFGDKRTTLVVENDAISIADIADLLSDTNGLAVYQSFVGELKDVQTIFFSGRYVNMPMIEGRFFKNSDFTKSNFCAVIGKNKLGDCLQTSDGLKIIINGIIFDVLGVLGPDSKTSFDEKILINAMAAPELFIGRLYTFDYLSGSADNEIARLTHQLNDKYVVDVKVLSMEESLMSRTLPRLFNGRLFILLILCAVLCVLLVTLEWRNRKQREVSIKMLLGIKRTRLIFEIVTEYVVLAMGAAMLGVVGCLLIYPHYERSLLVGTMYYIPFAIVLVSFSVRSLIKKPIYEGIA